MACLENEVNIIQRVRAILLSDNETLMFIKRVKPDPQIAPYWVAPGGGVEPFDDGLLGTLKRELMEELGARIDVLSHAFVLEHEKAGKALEEHFYVCRLIDYDLRLRHGPEFADPTRGLYLPDEVLLSFEALSAINIKTPELRDWLLCNFRWLRRAAA